MVLENIRVGLEDALAMAPIIINLNMQTVLTRATRDDC